MMKFAHFADVHLGFQKLPSLQNLERKAIGGVIGGRISRKADFVPACLGALFFKPPPRPQSMKRAEAADAALKLMAAGRTAYIYHDGALKVGEDKPAEGKVILVGVPSRPVPRETLLVLLAHRMRMKGVR